MFDVRGVVWLRPETFYPRDRLYGEACRDYPVRVEGIPVHRTCRTLHVLHAVNNLGYSSKADCQTYASQGWVVASYVFQLCRR